MFSLRFSGSKLLINLRRQFRVHKNFSYTNFCLRDLQPLHFVFKITISKICVAYKLNRLINRLLTSAFVIDNGTVFNRPSDLIIKWDYVSYAWYMALFCQHRKMKNLARVCWRIVPATVEEPCQWLLNNRASDCWRIMPAAVEQSCQWLLNNRVSDSSTSKCPCNNVCLEIPFRVSSYHIKSVFYYDVIISYDVKNLKSKQNQWKGPVNDFIFTKVAGF